MAESSLKSKTKRGLYWKFSEQLATYGMQFVVGIVMARLLSPSDFGTAALPAVFIAIAQVFIDGSFGLALIRKPEVTEKDLATSFYYSIAVGIFFYIIIFFSAPFIADFYGVPILKPLIRFTSLSFLWSPLNTPQTVLLQRRLDFKTPARISIINKIISSAIGIFAAYKGYGIWALAISTLSSSFLGVLQTWFAVRWIPREHFSKESFRYLWNFGNKMMITGLLHTIYSNIVTVIIGKSGGTNELGNLNRAKGFASLPSSNLTGVLQNVTFPVLSKFQDDDEQLEYQYRRMIKVSSFVVFPIMLLMCALARPMVITLVTEKWADCIVLLQIMCFTYMLQPVQMLNLNLLQVKGRTDLTLKLEVVKKIIGFVVFIIAAKYGLLTVCIVDFVCTIFALVCNTHFTGKILGLNFFKQIKDLFSSFALSVLMMFIVTLEVYFIENNVVALLVGGVSGIAFYFGMAYLLKFQELEDVKYMVKVKS